MVVQPTEPDQVVEAEDVNGDASDERSASRSGYVLPLVHTAIDATLVTADGGHRVVIAVDDVKVETPPIEHLAFYVGLGVLVGVGLVELPVAAALGVGHILIEATRRPGLRALGEALGEA